MRKTIRCFVAFAVLAVMSLLTVEPAAATGPPAAVCADYGWYLHAPYVVGGGIQSWATCVHGGVVPWPDWSEASSNGQSALVAIQTWTNGQLTGQNFECQCILQTDESSVVAAAPYVPGATYQSAFLFRNARNTVQWWVVSYAVVR